MTKRATPRLWPVLLAAGVGLLILLSLGVWQVQRLAQKNAMIAAIDASLASPPVPLDEALAGFLDGKNIDYRKVKALGHFAPREPLRLIATLGGGPAWELVHGFEQPNGAPVLVNRGRIAEGKALPPPVPGEVEIVGLVHWHDKGRGVFDVDNKPNENRWYWWDVVAMSQQFSATHLDPNYVVLDLIPGSPGTEGLQVDPPKANLRNNHLGYAITWFGLAAALLAVTGVFLWTRGKQS